jgi:hypothetical protein
MEFLPDDAVIIGAKSACAFAQQRLFRQLTHFTD